MTGWILVSVAAALLLLIGVVALRRRLSRTRRTERAASAAGPDAIKGVGSFFQNLPTGTQEVKKAPDPLGSTDAMPNLGSEVLEHLRGLEAKGSPGLAAEVVEIFLQDTSTRLKALREAVAQRDGEAAYRVAHTLHGSASMVGALSLARSCAELIKAARSGSFDRCEAIVADLDAGFEAIQRVVTE